MASPFHLRIARPVADPARSAERYCRGLGWSVLGRFTDHAGFDGVMVGDPQAPYHLEFTRSRNHPLVPSPTPEDLVVLYIPDDRAWRAACEQMVAAGFRPVTAFNPYWDVRGRSFEDGDGYRVVLQAAAWTPG